MTEREPRPLRERLADEIGICLSPDLAAHIIRGAVFRVAPALELLEVACALAQDQAELVQGWIEQGEIARPSRSQIQAWEGAPEMRFRVVIVRPYVLVQPLLEP